MIKLWTIGKTGLKIFSEQDPKSDPPLISPVKEEIKKNDTSMTGQLPRRRDEATSLRRPFSCVGYFVGKRSKN